MSGIAVIYNLNGKPVESAELSAMKKALAHRGRDGGGILKKEAVGLVHLMTHTCPQSITEKLPFADFASKLSITCDARIDNRAELLKSLEFRESPDEISDSEIILAAYEKWGEDSPSHLIGDFVFAIWDENTQKLFCARDALGVKHFYYYFHPGKIFVLSSEIKGLLALEDVPNDLDETHLGDFLVLNSEDKESTFYRGIKRLPATHSLRVKADGLCKKLYWKPSSSELRLKNAEEYQEAFLEKLDEAVVCRLRSAFPVGSMLSGGLDSSSIVCLAAKHLKEKTADLHTFSAIFPSVAKVDRRIDEVEYMQAVIRQTGCRAHFVKADDESPLREIDKLLWHADDPVGAPNVYMDWAIYQAAENKGVRVLLSGTDGDSTVSHGYEDFAHFVKRGRFIRLLKESLALSRNMPRRTHRFSSLFLHRGIAKGVPPHLLKLWRILRRRKAEDYAKSTILFQLNFDALQTDFRENYDIESRITKFWEENYPNFASSAEMHWNALTGGHFSSMLENLEKSAAAFGIEPRYPFFDRRLIEFCIALPPGQRIYNGWTRSIFRHAMKDILPPEVCWRIDKSNIGASVKINLLKYGYPQLEESIGKNAWKLEKYINPEKLKTAYRNYQLDPLRRESEALLILTAVYLLKWLENNDFVEPLRVQSANRLEFVA